MKLQFWLTFHHANPGGQCGLRMMAISRVGRCSQTSARPQHFEAARPGTESVAPLVLSTIGGASAG